MIVDPCLKAAGTEDVATVKSSRLNPNIFTNVAEYVLAIDGRVGPASKDE